MFSLSLLFFFFLFVLVLCSQRERERNKKCFIVLWNKWIFVILWKYMFMKQIFINIRVLVFFFSGFCFCCFVYNTGTHIHTHAHSFTLDSGTQCFFFSHEKYIFRVALVDCVSLDEMRTVIHCWRNHLSSTGSRRVRRKQLLLRWRCWMMLLEHIYNKREREREKDISVRSFESFSLLR